MECTPDESMPMRASPWLDELWGPQLVAFGDAHREAGHVEVAAGELPGVLGGLAAEQHALGSAAALVHAAHDLGDALGHDLADDQVVQEEQRRRAARRHVVDAHRHQVDADGVEPVHGPRDLDLGADPIRARDEHRVLEAAAGRMAPPKPPRPPRTSGCRVLVRRALRRSTARVARLDVDSGLLVRELVVGQESTPPLPAGADPLAAAGAYCTAPASDLRREEPRERVAKAGEPGHRLDVDHRDLATVLEVAVEDAFQLERLRARRRSTP